VCYSKHTQSQTRIAIHGVFNNAHGSPIFNLLNIGCACPAMRQKCATLSGKAKHHSVFRAAMRSQFTNLSMMVDSNHIKPLTALALRLLQACSATVQSFVFTMTVLNSSTRMVLKCWAHTLNARVFVTANRPRVPSANLYALHVTTYALPLVACDTASATFSEGRKHTLLVDIQLCPLVHPPRF